jgi:hypothetical protein
MTAKSNTRNEIELNEVELNLMIGAASTPELAGIVGGVHTETVDLVSYAGVFLFIAGVLLIAPQMVLAFLTP